MKKKKRNINRRKRREDGKKQIKRRREREAKKVGERQKETAVKMDKKMDGKWNEMKQWRGKERGDKEVQACTNIMTRMK